MLVNTKFMKLNSYFSLNCPSGFLVDILNTKSISAYVHYTLYIDNCQYINNILLFYKGAQTNDFI